MQLIINGIKISTEDFEQELQAIKQKVADFDAHNPAHLEMAKAMAKENIIHRVLIENAALIEVEDEEIDYNEVRHHFAELKKYFDADEPKREYYRVHKQSDFAIQRDIEKSLRINKLLEKWTIPAETWAVEDNLRVFYTRLKARRYENKEYEEVADKVRSDFLDYQKNALIKSKLVELKQNAIIEQVEK